MKSAWLIPRPRSVTRPPASISHRTSSSAPPSQPQLPHSIQAAKAAAHLAHTTANPSPRFRDAWEELGSTLTRLPPAQPAAGEVPLRHLGRAELEQRWSRWAQASLEAHHALSGNPSEGRRRRVESSVVRVVAHTMRLSLMLGRWRDALQLERAFFSQDEPSKLDDNHHHTPDSHQKPESSPSLRLKQQKPFHALSGLGLRRGGIRQAWLSSLQLRLRPDAHPSLSAFLDLLVQLRKHVHASAEAGVSPHVLASLARLSDPLAARMEAEGVVKAGQGQHTVAQMLHNLGGGSESPVQDDSVLKALAEVELAHLEGVRRLGHRSWPRWRNLTTLAQRLMQHIDDTHQATSVSDDLLGYSQTKEEAKAIEGRAETLHIAIRFLLLQARLAADGHHGARAGEDHLPTPAQSLASALSLYSSLFQLVPRVAGFPAQLVQLRTKQSATLYRLMWAAIGTFDVNNAPEVHQNDIDHKDVPLLSAQAFNDVHLLLDNSLASVRAKAASASPATADGTTGLAKAWPMGISSLCFRRLLYCHTLPSAPSRRQGKSKKPAVRPPWAALHRTLSIIIDVKRHDLACAAQQPAPPASLKHRLLNRSSLLFNLFRATLLGGSDPSLPGEGSHESRLYLLLEWLSELDKLPGEGVDRAQCKTIVRAVFGTELVGDVWADRKEGLMGMVGRWALGLSPLSLAGQQRVEPLLNNTLSAPSSSTRPWEHDTPPHQQLPMPFSPPPPPSVGPADESS